MTTEVMARVRRAATYERVSSDDQRERETIKTQRDALDRRLATEPNVEVVARYQDDGVSGTIALASRPDGGRLLRDAAAGRFDELWVVAIDRLGRDAPDVLLARRRLAVLGVRLMTLAGPVHPLAADIEAVVGDYARVMFLANAARGMYRAAREGRYCGGIVPLGYVVDGRRAHAHLVPDETPFWAGQSAADLVRWIYERLGVDGWSCRQIAVELNDRGVQTHYARDGRLVKRDNRKQRTQGLWRAGRIRNLATNPVYRGEQRYGQRTTRPLLEREDVRAPVIPLVTPALWHAAQDTLAANRVMAKNTRRRYLLRGAIRCGICGLTYCGSQGRDEVGWYRCTGQLAERGPISGRCWGQSIRTDAIEPIVWADIERWLRDPGEVLDDLDGPAERDAEGAVAVAESITLAGALDVLEGQRKQVLALNIRGRLLDRELDAELDRIAAEKAALEARVAALAPADAQDVPQVAVGLLTELRARLDAGLTVEQRQEIVRLLVRVVVHTESPTQGRRKTAKATVQYRFPAVVETHTGIREGLNYTVVRRVIELPGGRRRRKEPAAA